MKKIITQSEQKYFLMNLKLLTYSARQEVLDFMGYLLAKTESDEDATREIIKDKKMMSGIKKGLANIKQGKVSRFEL